MSELLAKSGGLGLQQHCIDVADVAQWTFGTESEPTRLCRMWLRFFDIPREQYPVFWINLIAACASHDWGKANSDFQGMLKQKTSQAMYHEHVSGLMLSCDEVMQWLRRRPGVDPEMVLAAVLCHHLRVAVKAANLEKDLPPGARFQVHTDHPEFQSLIAKVRERLNVPGSAPCFPPEKIWSEKGVPGTLDLLEHIRRLASRLHRLDRSLQQDRERMRMLWAVRAALIVADAAGSGLRRGGQKMEGWLQAVFDENRLCTADFIESEVIAKRIAHLGNRWVKWSDFQEQAGHLPDRALLLAPCGSGKTMAAWKWIANQLKEPRARVLFLYPTRATATEGFKDYVSWAPEADASLLHGTADFDLECMFENPTDPNDPRRQSEFEVDRRLFALAFWTRRVFSATVDQFLSFMQYSYGPMCLLPLLADSVIVIDEVHSFDKSMFTTLKEFLKNFKVPVLCMTATLQNARYEALVNECNLRPYNDKPGELQIIAGAARYRVGQTDETKVLDIIRSALDKGKRVLWVVNLVKRAQAKTREMTIRFDPTTDEELYVRPGVRLYCYHSRFRLIDRVKRHQEVVGAFTRDAPPALAVTTQVCEMSLDMDADVLITEICPITSLIQRMGRCNRAREPRMGAGQIWVYKPTEHKPYDEKALTGIDEFLVAVQGGESVSQGFLEAALEQAPAPPNEGDRLVPFLCSGPYALGGDDEFREIDEFTRPGVLKRDIDDFLRADRAQQPGFFVPVPKHLGKERDPRLPTYVAVADDGHYHPAIGFCDDPVR
jgi:CRISPR-associated endonuclease/helicase Cas3